MEQPLSQVAITNVIARFANNFDRKDWNALADTLMETIECDYRDLRGTIETYSRDEYVQARKTALDALQTQHLFCNLDITLDESSATCQASAVIYRKNEQGLCFNSHALYVFELSPIPTGDWKIAKIKQNILWNDGDATIHSGAAHD